ncbi:ABC transporter ATP-binding protein [Microbacterium sp. No. 7]|uniref:ABC transporter ATP-binding protein n=1 Tax=Microbacterium sp. No. 7 TaxID=1714373 RepID=UPI0006D1A693|nr:ABC transporter ATP-binding protein [Microbacterium sp. No. 7]ALJ21843.1 hypothetical protein AOA12_18850 [Microbacterium sp. No. 7]
MSLDVRSLTAGYGDHTVLRDIDISVRTGEVVAVLGTNGAGKSTLLRTIAGLQPLIAGRVELDGTVLDRMPAFLRVRHGLALAPEGQQSFANMTVKENLVLAARAVRRRASRHDIDEALGEVIGTFPRLGQRMSQSAGTLSGGERQMLSISRALLAKPKVLLLDEPSHGLAPIVVEQVAESIAAISGTALLLVEQNLAVPRRCATRVVVLQDSRIVASGGRELVESDEVVEAYLGID